MATILDIVGLVNAARAGGSRSRVHTHRTSLLLRCHHMPLDTVCVVCLVDVVPRKKDETEDFTYQSEESF